MQPRWTFRTTLCRGLRALAALVATSFVSAAAAGELRLDVEPFYQDSVLRGSFGGKPVYFFLGPSPIMERAVVAFIDSADRTLDLCLYDFDVPEFADAILAAHERGVKVRMILAKENAQKAYPVLEHLKTMKSLGILTLADNRSGLMHNKFMVADGTRVWTGSYNLTRNCSRFNDNHAILLESPELAVNYECEWEEIFQGHHGKRNTAATPNPRVRIGPVEIENYFTPEDATREAIVRVIDQAQSELAILAYVLTDGPMIDAIRRAVGRGVRVLIVLDTGMASHPANKVRELRATGASVRLSPDVLLHHKVIVADRKTVVLGSANFSQAGFDKNDENVLVIHSTAFASAMLREAQRCWRAEPYAITKWRTQVPAISP